MSTRRFPNGSWIAATLLLAAGAANGEPAYLDVYLALGEPGAIHVEGRALGGTPLPVEESGDWAVVNALRITLAAASDELPGVTIEVAPADPASGEPVRTTTDGEGFFSVSFPGGTPDGAPAGPLSLEIRLDAPGYEAPSVRVEATVLPAEGARVVITDFDDTLAATQVDRPLLFAVRLLLANGAQLTAVPGAAECLGALARDTDALVVLSGNPVNFRPRLESFLRSHGFPAAWFVLRDFGVGPEADPLDVGAFKRRELDRLAAVLPHARFVLLGDAGEHDTEVYEAFRTAHPDRAEPIWIRRIEGAAASSTGTAGGAVFFDDYADLRCDLEPAPTPP